MEDRKNKIAVIIPFFQREIGILTKAVNSVVKQEGEFDIHLVVVDDESPVPAKDELAQIAENINVHICIIEQKNTGPGGARNAGIESLDDDTDFVALLDSDDEWTEQHLYNAISALNKGYDIYFSNFIPFEDGIPYFKTKEVDLSNYRNIDGVDGAYEVSDSFFNKLFVKTDLSPIGTSTVVYRYSRLGHIRFPEDFNIGEDTTFFLKLAAATDLVCFGAEVECVYGKGVNIFAGSGWGTRGMLSRSSNAVFFRKYLSSEFDLSDEQKKIQSVMIEEYRRNFMRSFLHALRHPDCLDMKVVGRHFVKDPLTMMSLFHIFFDRS